LFPKVNKPYAFTWKLSVASVMFLWLLKYQSEALQSAAPLVQYSDESVKFTARATATR